MKWNLFLFVFGVMSAVSSMGHAINPDGCFQMYLPNTMYPVICVSGSNEEGINGSGVRVSVVGPNSLEVRSCAKTSSMDLEGDTTKNKTTFWFQNGDFVKFDGSLNPETKREEGNVLIGKSTFNYIRLRNQETQMVLDAVSKSGKCNQ